MKYEIGYKFWLRGEFRHLEAIVEGYVTIERINNQITKAYLISYRDEQGTPFEINRAESWIDDKMKRG